MLPFASHLGAPPAPRPQPVTKSGPSTLPPQPPPGPSSSSEHESTAKEKDKKRKRDDEDEDEDDEDEAYKDRYDMSAQSLVQQARCNTMFAEKNADGQLPVGVGTSCTSRCNCRRPSFWKLRTCVSSSSRLSDALRFRHHRTAYLL